MEAIDPRPSCEPEPGLRALLDHIAVELAHEYIRLMEEAASEEIDAVATAPVEQGGQS